VPSSAPLPFQRLSFSRQFLLTSGVLLLAAMAGLATWISHQIENNATTRAARVTAAYVESIVAPQLRDWSGQGPLPPAAQRSLDEVFIDGPLTRKVVRFKLWSPDGRIVYSSNHAQIGQQFEIEPDLAYAFSGELYAHVSGLEEADSVQERDSWSQLLEVYVPIRAEASGPVRAVAEFYHSMNAIEQEILIAQQRSWLLVAIGGCLVFAVFYGRVRHASNTIVAQQRDLSRQLEQLRAALRENEQMRERLANAGARATDLNEQFLQRIAADLHDGPAQELSFALLRFDELALNCGGCFRADVDERPELTAIHRALQSSLEELRVIAAGLGVPGIAGLSLADTARRALRDCQQKWPGQIEALLEDSLGDASLATKITVYRLLQESIANSRRHADPSHLAVSLQRTGNELLVRISDQGAGFDPKAALASGRLGLPLMRERVRTLGGDLEIQSVPGQGTTISARLPLGQPETPPHA
jgi:hypothetical protein